MSSAPLELPPGILHSLLDSLDDAAFVVDENGRLVLSNQAGEFIARIPEVQLRVARALRGERIEGQELFLRPPETAEGIWFSVSARPLSDTAGEPCGAILVLRDVTAHKKSVEALQHSEQRFATFMRHLPGVAFIKDRDGRYIFYNEAVEGIAPEQVHQFLGKTDDDIWPPEYAAAFRKNDEEVFRTGAPLQTVESAPHPDGMHSYEIYKFPLADETGEVAYVAGVGIDITERRQLEDQLRHSQKLEAVGRLAGGVAHDFNNLLTVISGYGHMLLKGIAESDSLHSCVEELLRASNRAAGLTNQLLAFSRRQIIKPQVLDINALVANMDRMLRRVIGEHIHLETSLSADVGTVMADAGQLEQVLMNLTVNARDAMPQGGTLSIRTTNVDVSPASHRRSEVRPGSYVVIEVADTGSGIDAETMLHLFEPFYTSKEVGKGTGLGLSTVYGIIKQSGGDVAVESYPAAGTTFRMYLPRRHEAAVISQQIPNPTQLGGAEVILLVEDEAGVRQLVREMLRTLGYSILEAGSGEEAIRLFNENMDRIDLLLTDVIMPRMSGRELSQRLRSARPLQKVLYMSGYPDDVLAQHRAPGESVFLLQKPFEPDALARKVREVLDAPGAFATANS